MMRSRVRGRVAGRGHIGKKNHENNFLNFRFRNDDKLIS